MSQQHQINDPHLVSLLLLARERAESIGGESGKAVHMHADNCAAILQGYIDQPHTMANDPRLQGEQ